MSRSLVVAMLLIAAPLCAQQDVRTVNPGMSKAQVTAALGQPATIRTVSDFTYMFYLNSCGKRCGMNDLVILQRDSVVDAIFRAPSRRYTGASSSPAPITPAAAAKQRPTNAGEPVRMKPGAPNDVRPSIPVNPPKVQPAPASKSPAVKP
jgi:hypothetical protein